MSDTPETEVAVLNIQSAVGIGVSFAIAAAALFALPTLQNTGIGFNTAFWIVSAVELVTALAIAYFVLNLHETRG